MYVSKILAILTTIKADSRISFCLVNIAIIFAGIIFAHRVNTDEEVNMELVFDHGWQWSA